MYLTKEETLVQLKSDRTNQLTASCKSTTYAGNMFSYTDLDGEVQQIYIAGGEEISMLLASKATTCSRLEINFSCSDASTGDFAIMSYEEGLRFTDEIMVWGSDQWEKKKKKQNLVNDATTLEGICAITWDSEDVV